MGVQTSPYPDLQVYPQSGLSFAWAEYSPQIEGTFEASLGPDGCGCGLVMLIAFDDLLTACQEILGFSYRKGPGILSRNLPWQHPYFNQLFAKSISRVKGIQMRELGTLQFPTRGGGTGPGSPRNLGPWTQFQFAQLTIQFWRPPYEVLSDSAVGVEGMQQEWLRYTERHYEANTRMLSREGGTFVWSAFQQSGPTAGNPFPGTVGQPISHQKIAYTWHQIPEAGIFTLTGTPTGQLPNGIPGNLLYMRTTTTNLITGYQNQAGIDYSNPLVGCVNSPIGGGVVDEAGPPGNRFLGFFPGTVLYEAVDMKPIPLQLPPYLMNIPEIAQNEAISQVQYDITFHYDVFDPPRAEWGAGPSGLNVRGHNLVPYAGDGLWYACRSQNVAPNQDSFLTPFNYADLSDAWEIL